MKTMKKVTLITVFAVVILAAALIIGCSQPMGGNMNMPSGTAGGGNGGNVNNGENPTGNTSSGIRVVIKTSARSVLPAVTDNITYKIDFIAGSTPGAAGGTSALTTAAQGRTYTSAEVNAGVEFLVIVTAGTVTGGDFSLPVASGDYWVKVTAIDMAVTESQAAGFAEGNSITALHLDLNGNDVGKIYTFESAPTLDDGKLPLFDPASPDTGTGHFSYINDWAIFHKAITSAYLNITVNTASHANTGAAFGADRNINIAKGEPTQNGELSLPTGYYDITYTIALASGKNAVYREILHVYQNMKSTMNLFRVKGYTGGDDGPGGENDDGNGITDDLFDPEEGIVVEVSDPTSPTTKIWVGYSGTAGSYVPGDNRIVFANAPDGVLQVFATGTTTPALSGTWSVVNGTDATPFTANSFDLTSSTILDILDGNANNTYQIQVRFGLDYVNFWVTLP